MYMFTLAQISNILHESIDTISFCLFTKFVQCVCSNFKLETLSTQCIYNKCKLSIVATFFLQSNDTSKNLNIEL